MLRVTNWTEMESERKREVEVKVEVQREREVIGEREWNEMVA